MGMNEIAQDVLRDPSMSDYSRGRLVGALTLLVVEVDDLRTELNALRATVETLKDRIPTPTKKRLATKPRPIVPTTSTNCHARSRAPSGDPPSAPHPAPP